MRNKLNVLIGCEYSGNVRDAFLAKGHNAISCDLLPSDRPGPHYQGDIFDIIDDGWDIGIFHPPCTRLANSGVRWLAERDLWDEMREAAEFYIRLRNAKKVKKKCLENPIMHKYAREILGNIKRQVVQPWWFGEEMFKGTGYELHGLPDLLPTNKLTPPLPGTPEHKAWSWVHRCPPGPDRWKIRSTTPLGIAQAMAEQWG